MVLRGHREAWDIRAQRGRLVPRGLWERLVLLALRVQLGRLAQQGRLGLRVLPGLRGWLTGDLMLRARTMD